VLEFARRSLVPRHERADFRLLPRHRHTQSEDHDAGGKHHRRHALSSKIVIRTSPIANATAPTKSTSWVGSSLSASCRAIP
jgi:hypothetical protein